MVKVEGFRFGEPTVGHAQDYFIANGFQNGRQETLTGRNFFEANMLAQMLALVDKVVHCESIDEPFAHRVALYVATVFYIIASIYRTQ